ncbi:MAG: alpha/beta fold hydrolase [Salegentibacter sp.]
MNTQKVNFHNKSNEELAGYIELPLNRKPHNFVIFAHCFTCNKNFFAPKNISRSLAAQGYGVLRFDFTGLGESHGEFAATNFSGNIQDLIAAAEFLEKEYQAPSLLVGHSLGGAAVLFAAKRMKSVKAVATIAAPSDLDHVKGLLKSDEDEIRKNGKAKVNIGGRDFTIKEQFLKDLESHQLKSYLKEFEKSLLILHSPQDKVVNISNAESIYIAAHHPKSFISLDGADHLLSDEKQSSYAGKLIAVWAEKYIEVPETEELETEHEVVASLGAEGLTTQMQAGRHPLVADEPIKAGGNAFGPTPYEYLSLALAACTSMTIQMYSRRKEWPLENVETHVTYSKEHAEDCEKCEKENSKIDTFERAIALDGPLDEKQRNRLLEIANKCPVHRTLTSHTQVRTKLKDAALR